MPAFRPSIRLIPATNRRILPGEHKWRSPWISGKAPSTRPDITQKATKRNKADFAIPCTSCSWRHSDDRHSWLAPTSYYNAVVYVCVVCRNGHNATNISAMEPWIHPATAWSCYDCNNSIQADQRARLSDGVAAACRHAPVRPAGLFLHLQRPFRKLDDVLISARVWTRWLGLSPGVSARLEWSVVAGLRAAMYRNFSMYTALID